MYFSYVTSPTGSSSGRSRNPKRNSLLPGQYPYSFHPLPGNYISRKNLIVFLHHRRQITDKIFYTLDKIRMYIGHHSSDDIIIHNQTSSTGFLQQIQYLFPVPESIEKSRQGPQIHTEGGPKQQMRSNTGQLVHNSPDIDSPFGHLQSQGLFNAHTQSMPVLMGR